MQLFFFNRHGTGSPSPLLRTYMPFGYWELQICLCKLTLDKFGDPYIVDKCNGRHSAADKIFAPGHLMGATQCCGEERVKMLWNHCGTLVKANQISEWRCIGLTAKEERVEEETKYPHERMSCRMCLTGSKGPPTETAREKRERERERGGPLPLNGQFPQGRLEWLARSSRVAE